MNIKNLWCTKKGCYFLLCNTKMKIFFFFVTWFYFWCYVIIKIYHHDITVLKAENKNLVLQKKTLCLKKSSCCTKKCFMSAKTGFCCTKKKFHVNKNRFLPHKKMFHVQKSYYFFSGTTRHMYGFSQAECRLRKPIDS